MHIRYYITLLIICSALLAKANVIEVSSQSSFDAAMNSVTTNDTIAWADGTYQDIYLNIKKSDLAVIAANPGKAIFTGNSWLVVKGDRVIVSGLQFLDGNIGTKNVMESFGNYVHFNDININGYTSYKYLVIRAECQYNEVSYCNFENRLNLADKNILSVLVDNVKPGYHLIRYCSFKNFAGIGADMGIEPIRIGLSTQGEFSSRTVVEYCYFTQCNGDGEIISNKSRQNVFRYNTFEDNPKSELVLRHGDEGVVYGNFFLNGKGGVRIKEGQHHVVFNNYFDGLTDRPLILQNYDVDPLDSVLIAFNTFVNCNSIQLGGSGLYPPQNITFANNALMRESGSLFSDATGMESWIGNMYEGDSGIPANGGLTNNNLNLIANSHGFYSPEANSPLINAALGGFPIISSIEGLEIDNEIVFDVMQGVRPGIIDQKDVGASEYETAAQVKPHVTEKNTGPSYFREKYTLNLDDQGYGSVEVDPLLEEYEPGAVVTITAFPNDGFEFYYWSGDKGSLSNPDTVVMSKNKRIVANWKVITGFNEASTGQLFSVFPNPVHDKVEISFTTNGGGLTQIDLCDNLGRVLMPLVRPSILSGKIRLEKNLSSLPAGIYIVALSGKVNSQKTIIKL